MSKAQDIPTEKVDDHTMQEVADSIQLGSPNHTAAKKIALSPEKARSQGGEGAQ